MSDTALDRPKGWGRLLGFGKISEMAKKRAENRAYREQEFDRALGSILQQVVLDPQCRAVWEYNDDERILRIEKRISAFIARQIADYGHHGRAIDTTIFEEDKSATIALQHPVTHAEIRKRVVFK